MSLLLAQESFNPITLFTFFSEDGQGVPYPYDDAIVTVVKVNVFIVKMILMDSGSFYNFLTWKAINSLQVDMVKLNKVTTLLIGISRKPMR